MNAVTRSNRLAQALLLGALTMLPATTLFAAPPASHSQYNLSKSHVAIDGYDPVAYFPEGGGTPAKGDKKFTLTEGDITYWFTSQDHLDLFKANPEKYAPAHGGWCSYAMGNDGTKVEVDPKSFLVNNDRLFLFYKDLFNDTRKSFIKDQARLTKTADANWQKLSGERSRDGKPTLSAQLKEMQDKATTALPPDKLKLYQDSIDEVAKSGVLERALKVGDTAPDFSLSDAMGKSVHLADLRATGPVIITWYRGGWCPYCNIQLRDYQQSLFEIKAAGGHLVAISPQRPDESLSTAEKDKLEFAVLSDPGNAVARSYGIAYKLPQPLIDGMKGRLDLPKINGDSSWELPLAATYVVGKDGKIAYAFTSADYRTRAETAEVVAALKAAAGK